MRSSQEARDMTADDTTPRHVGYHVYWKPSDDDADKPFIGPVPNPDGTAWVAPLGFDDVLVETEGLPLGAYMLVPVDEQSERVVGLPRVLVVFGDQPPTWVRGEERDFVVGALARFLQNWSLRGAQVEDEQRKTANEPYESPTGAFGASRSGSPSSSLLSIGPAPARLHRSSSRRAIPWRSPG
jgi:hypothetical protein